MPDVIGETIWRIGRVVRAKVVVESLIPSIVECTGGPTSGLKKRHPFSLKRIGGGSLGRGSETHASGPAQYRSARQRKEEVAAAFKSPEGMVAWAKPAFELILRLCVPLMEVAEHEAVHVHRPVLFRSVKSVPVFSRNRTFFGTIRIAIIFTRTQEILISHIPEDIVF
jgi:hypothetical protein